mmetsp:Transcript_42952/g.69691  ORF Transcript_42952/g.69691 Transcript_42952/m.69691 type:complete len:284 (+) Transcript_42952:21-872(+)
MAEMFISIYLSGLLTLVPVFCSLWPISVCQKDASIIDPVWPVGSLVAVTVYFLQTDGYSGRKAMIWCMVAIWAIRMAFFLLYRNWGQPEDHRYQNFRKHYGAQYWWISLFQVFLLQSLLCWVVSAPLLSAQISRYPSYLTALDCFGVFLWAFGLTWESIADWQLFKFKKNPNNKGKICSDGLWNLCRHPNYFGEAVVAWGYWCCSAATGERYWTIFGPAVMTFLLIKVSGVALLEATLMKRRGYQEYADKVPAFLPVRIHFIPILFGVLAVGITVSVLPFRVL